MLSAAASLHEQLGSPSASQRGSVFSAHGQKESLVANLEGYELASLNAAPIMSADGREGQGAAAGGQGEVDQVPRSYPGRGVRVLGAETLPGPVDSPAGPRKHMRAEPAGAGAGRQQHPHLAPPPPKHTVPQEEFETWEEVGRRQRRIDAQGLDMEGMLQVPRKSLNKSKRALQKSPVKGPHISALQKSPVKGHCKGAVLTPIIYSVRIRINNIYYILTRTSEPAGRWARP